MYWLQTFYFLKANFKVRNSWRISQYRSCIRLCQNSESVCHLILATQQHIAVSQVFMTKHWAPNESEWKYLNVKFICNGWENVSIVVAPWKSVWEVWLRRRSAHVSPTQTYVPVCFPPHNPPTLFLNSKYCCNFPHISCSGMLMYLSRPDQYVFTWSTTNYFRNLS